MTTNVRPKPVPKDVSRLLLDQMEATLDKLERQGYCPCCIARCLLLHAGLLAAHELEPADMRNALGYIATLSARHAPPPASTSRH